LRITGSEEGVAFARRPQGPLDEAFLYRLYAGTREEEMALWNASAEQREAFLRFQFDAQRAHYVRHFPDARHDVVTIDGEPRWVARSLHRRPTRSAGRYRDSSRTSATRD
jgi:hypothetical protein